MYLQAGGRDMLRRSWKGLADHIQLIVSQNTPQTTYNWLKWKIHHKSHTTDCKSKYTTNPIHLIVSQNTIWLLAYVVTCSFSDPTTNIMKMLYLLDNFNGNWFLNWCVKHSSSVDHFIQMLCYPDCVYGNQGFGLTWFYCT